MELLFILALAAFWVYAKRHDAVEETRKAEAHARLRYGPTPAEKAACLDTHGFAGETCADCGVSRGAARKFGWACDYDRSEFAETLRTGGWGKSPRDHETFKAAYRAYRRDRSRVRGAGRTDDADGFDPSRGPDSSGGDSYRGDEGGDGWGLGDREADALAVLGLTPGAAPDEIKEAWRDLCRVWHPDRFGSDERLRTKATARLAEINEAYQTLLST